MPVAAGPARGFLLGLDGPEVRVPGRVASALVAPLRAWIAHQAGAGELPDAEVIATVHALDVAASIHGASVNGSQPTPALEVFTSASGNLAHASADVVHHAPMTTKATAQRLGCSERNVVDLVARSVLSAHRLGRVWAFDPADVDRYAAQRAARGA